MGQSSPSRRTSAASLMLLVLFFGGLWLPLLGNALGFAPASDARSEKRRLAHMPRLAPTGATAELPGPATWAEVIDRFPREFEDYYDDHFGFRPTLLRAHHVWKARVFATSPTDQAVIGDDGWLFYAGQGGIKQFQAVSPLTEDELREWERRLEIAAEWLDDRGIEFLFYVAPAKPSIYGDHLPSRIRRVGQQSRLDQFVAHMRANSSVRVIDPREPFLAARDEVRLYRKTDTHWNQAGGLIGYQVLAEVLREDWPAIEIPALEDYEITVERIPGGDVATVMGLADVFREEALHLDPRDGWPYRRIEEGLMPPLHQERREVADERRPRATERDEPGLPRLVLFRDSFGTELIPYLGTGVSRGVYYWQFVIDPRVVAFENPHVVVQEIGERVLMFDKLNHIQNELTVDFERRRAFRAADRTLYSLADQDGRGRLIDGDGVLRLADGDRSPALALEAPQGRASFALQVPEAAGRDVILRLDLTAPDRVELRVSPGFERRLRLRRDIVYADFVVPDDGRLEVELQGAPGTYRITGLDLRSEP